MSGLEPLTPALSKQCSNQLSYTPKFYQLSYEPLFFTLVPNIHDRLAFMVICNSFFWNI